MAKSLDETCMDVFGGDAEVMEVDIEFPFGEVFDLDVFVLVFVVVVVVRRDEGVVCRRRGFGRGIGLRSASVGFLLHCHVVVSERTAGGRQNCWCRTLSGMKRSQQP